MKISELARILKESFTDISVQKLGISDIVNTADRQLEGPAADAIEHFVGVPHDAMSKQMLAGVMYSRQLEDAYSANPSQDGLEIRRQLESAFAPVRQALKSKFGDTITLYRGQGKVTDKKPRHTLSWTSDPRIAAWFAGVRPDEMKLKAITDQEIANAIKEYEQNGVVKWRGKKYIRTDEKTNDPKNDEFYYHIYDRDGEMITDGDNLEQDFRSDQEWFNEVIEKRDQKMSKVVSVVIPIDDIIWITDRAGQSEFILHNQPGKQGYIDATGKLIK